MGCAIKGHMLLETYVVLNNNLFKEKLLQQNMKNYLIIMAGLPGTGKTTTAKKLVTNLNDYVFLSQNDLRRKRGMKKMPKAQEEILRETDIITANLLREGRGVVFDSVNRYAFRRNHMYGIASSCGKNAILLECICSEKKAKERMQARDNSDGLLSDPNDPRVYDRLAALWEEIRDDFKYPGNNHISYVTFNTESLDFNVQNYTVGEKRFINKIEKILTQI